jgi:hypothetical protein
MVCGCAGLGVDSTPDVSCFCNAVSLRVLSQWFYVSWNQCFIVGSGFLKLPSDCVDIPHPLLLLLLLLLLHPPPSPSPPVQPTCGHCDWGQGRATARGGEGGSRCVCRVVRLRFLGPRSQ